MHYRNLNSKHFITYVFNDLALRENQRPQCANLMVFKINGAHTGHVIAILILFFLYIYFILRIFQRTTQNKQTVSQTPTEDNNKVNK